METIATPIQTKAAPVEHGKSTKNQKIIFWTADEWRDVALRLLKTNPHFLNSSHPVIHAKDLREAMAGLPPERRRPVSEPATKDKPGGGLSHFRKGFVRAYAEIRATLGGDVQLVATPQAIVDKPQEAIEAAIEAAVETPAPAATKNYRHNPRVKWTHGELLTIARHLRERYPNAGFVHSSTAAGLTLADVREGMTAALPPERHRPLNTMTTPLRKIFADAFKEARLEQLRQSERNAREEKLAVKAERESAAMPAPAAPADNLTAIAQMLRPMVVLLAKELLAQMEPQLQALIASAVQANSAAATTPAATPTEPPAQRPMAAPATVRRPRIGVVGPLPVQGNALSAAFPQYDIISMTTDNVGAAVSAMRNAIKVVGMIRFMNHPTEAVLMKNFGDKYVRVNGGTSAIKRQIEVWEATGALAAA